MGYVRSAIGGITYRIDGQTLLVAYASVVPRIAISGLDVNVGCEGLAPHSRLQEVLEG